MDTLIYLRCIYIRDMLVVDVEGPVLFVSADPFDFNVYDEFGLGV